MNNLQNRNNNLKSKLLHEQLRYGSYPFNSYRREMSRVLNVYHRYNSIFKAASALGLNKSMVMNWYVQGQMGNLKYRSFYLRVNHINNLKNSADEIPAENTVEKADVETPDGFRISPYGDGWSYTTYVDGEKIFIISGDLENLKSKIRSRSLPLD